MKEFMLIYQGGDKDWAAKTSPEDMQATMQKWGEWMQALSEKDQLVTGGHPLEYVGKRISEEKVVTDIASTELKGLVSGYSIIKAANLDDAVSIAKECPIFAHPNITVEVRPIHQM